MPQAEYHVVIEFNYTAQWDEDNQEVDADWLSDAIMDSFDNVDLEFDSDHATYDDKGDETEETFTVNVNCDTVRHVTVEPLRR